jgi:hypothetical protein
MYTLPGLSIAIVQLQAVPEPTSGSLFVASLLTVAAGRARGKRRGLSH